MRTIVVAVITCLCACESSQEAVDKMTPDAVKRFAVYQTAVNTALDRPVVTTPVLAEKLILPGGKKPPNADIIHREWLEYPVVHSTNEVLSEISSNFVDVRNLSHGSHPYADSDPKVYKQKFREFMSIKYLVIVSGSISGGVALAESYSGGGFTGSLDVIDIDKQVSLGAIEVSSGMSDKVQVVTGEGVKSSVEDQLQYDAKTHARKAVTKALAPFLDGESGRVP